MKSYSAPLGSLLKIGLPPSLGKSINRGRSAIGSVAGVIGWYQLSMQDNTVSSYRNSTTCNFLQFENVALKNTLYPDSSIHKANFQELSL